MLAIYEHVWKPLNVSRLEPEKTLWSYQKNGYTMKITFEDKLVEQDGFYQMNYKWQRKDDEVILTLFEDRQDNRILGLFISEYCYRMIKGKKLFEAKHIEECKKFGIYTTGTILEASTDTKGVKNIFVFQNDGWHKYEKPEAIVLFHLEDYYKEEELV